MWWFGDCGGLEKPGDDGGWLKRTGSTLMLMAGRWAEGASDAGKAVVIRSAWECFAVNC